MNIGMKRLMIDEKRVNEDRRKGIEDNINRRQERRIRIGRVGKKEDEKDWGEYKEQMRTEDWEQNELKVGKGRTEEKDGREEYKI